jgi:hypothetical protein
MSQCVNSVTNYGSFDGVFDHQDHISLVANVYDYVVIVTLVWWPMCMIT